MALIEWLQRSLTARLIGATTLFVALIWTIQIVQSISSHESFVTENINDRGSSLCRSAASFVADSLAKEDQVRLEERVLEFCKDYVDVEFIKVQCDGMIAAEFTAIDREGGIPQIFSAKIRDPRDRMEIGTLYLGLSIKRMEDALQGRLTDLTHQSIGLIAILVLLLAFSITRVVIRPVRELSRQASSLGQGSLETPVRLDRNDELGNLAKMLESMRCNLKQSRDEINRQNDELRALDRLKDEFLATMSHEIRTPMNGIVGMADLLAQTDLNEQQGAYIHALRQSGESLLRILNDILDFSKIQAGKLTIENVDFDLREVSEQVIEIFKETASRKGIRIEPAIDASVPKRVCGDGVRYRQILSNLLSNAVKFTEEGTVEIGVRVEHTGAGIEVIGSVTDSGIGIPEDACKRLFNRFEQADTSTTRKFGGTGLGLAISRQLCELMGGSIRVESEPGVGSKFEFRIQVLPPKSNAETPATDSHLQPVELPAGIRVLVADDTATNRTILRHMLERSGCLVECVENGAEAVQTCHDGDFDIVLMDCQMPEMDGFEATRRLRELGCELPVVAVTANAVAGTRETCLAAGMNDYISKPIRPRPLIRAVARWAVERSATGDDAET